jgi:hypothetical protein
MHAHNMKLRDMLTMVNKEVARKVSKEGGKEMPYFFSTLRKAVCFHVDVPEVSESSSSFTDQAPEC